MNKKIILRVGATLLTVAMVSCLLGGCEKNNSDDKSAQVDNQVSDNTSTVLDATGDKLKKDETVYVLCGADGAVSKIIVSDWIKNGIKDNSISDTTSLSDFSPVKGKTSYTMNSNNMAVWNANGGDVCYQGTSTSELPVNVSVSYKLDGKDISADDLAGKSGKVTIRFDYKNTQYKMVSIDGKDVKIYVPFIMMTGMLLDNNVFSNIEVSNGKVATVGSNTGVLGFALPGMQDDLDINKDDIDIPSFVEITADAHDFKLGNTVTLATNEIINNVDTSKLDSYDDIKSKMNELSDGVKALIDGSSAMYTNLGVLLGKSKDLLTAVNTLADASKKLDDGAQGVYEGSITLADKINELSSGLGKLAGSNDLLTGGASDTFDVLINAANTQLAATGLSVNLTKDNYGTIIDSITSEMIYPVALEQARKSVLDTVNQNYDTISNGVTDAVREQVVQGVTAQVYAGVLDVVTAGVRQNVYQQVVMQATNLDVDTYEQAVSNGSIPQQVQDTINTNVDNMMQSATATEQIQAIYNDTISSQDIKDKIELNTYRTMDTEDIKNTIEDNINDTVNDLVAQNMETDTVKQLIQSGIKDSLQALKQLKAQLDLYKSFYLGIQEYTSGVTSACDGSKKIYDGSCDLMGYLKEISDNLKKVDAGSKELADSVVALPDGVEQLKDGELQISDGLNKLNDMGLQKLSDIVNGDLNSLVVRLRAISDVSSAYNNYSGISDGMDGSVRFIYRTDSID